MKNILIVLLFVPVVGIAQTNSRVLEDSIPPDPTGMRNLTSVELAPEMVPGWNVGNSLEAIGGETAWGNPLITQRLIDSIKAAGFRAVRIPVAWSRFTDTATYSIDPAWLARVEQVVNYVLSDSMYAIINEHWDNGWIQPRYGYQSYVNNRLAAMWRQIAVHFRDYDDHLIFAGTNEVMVTGNYGTPTKEYYTVQNSYNQTFVATVRSTGGRNYYRHLAVQGFNTNIDHTVNYFAVPADVVPHRLIVEVHYYDPYNFTINSSSTVYQWGQNAPKSESWANEAYADGQFQKMKTNFIDKGYGVMLGEYGAQARLNLGSAALNAEHAGYRLYYIQYITGSLCKHGLVPFYWDNGYTGDNAMGLFNRSTGAKAYPEIIQAIIRAVDATPSGADMGILNARSQPAESSLKQNYPNPFNPTTTITFGLSKRTHAALTIHDVLGNEIIRLVDKELDAGTHSVVWNASEYGSGVYFCSLEMQNSLLTKRMLLLR